MWPLQFPVITAISLTLLISITLSTHLLAKKVPTPLKPFSFPILNSLYSAPLPLILTDFPLNVVSCTQKYLLTYVLTSLQSLLTYLWKSPHLQRRITSLQTYFLGDVVAGLQSD